MVGEAREMLGSAVAAVGILVTVLFIAAILVAINNERRY